MTLNSNSHSISRQNEWKGGRKTLIRKHFYIEILEKICKNPLTENG